MSDFQTESVNMTKCDKFTSSTPKFKTGARIYPVLPQFVLMTRSRLRSNTSAGELSLVGETSLMTCCTVHQCQQVIVIIGVGVATGVDTHVCHHTLQLCTGLVLSTAIHTTHSLFHSRRRQQFMILSNSY